MSDIEVHLFLPQMRMTMEAIVERARAAETAGFTGIALMDHLAPPMAEDQDMFEAMATAGWLLARTERLRVGHLVLCDALRHPAVLARQAVTLDHASGGRFELGLGWGSVPAELDTFGIGAASPRARVDRMAETLAIVRALWTGEVVDHTGERFELRGAQQRPVPTAPIPIVIGGAGPRTMALVAEHADWWNLPAYALDRLEELRPSAGSARVSTQQLVTLLDDAADRDDAVALVARRFGPQMASSLLAGTADEIVAHLGELADRGVERCYLWFTDFAPPSTLARFGSEVLARVPTVAVDGAG